MKLNQLTTGALLAATFAFGAASTAQADTDLDVMFIGDSITWGMTYTNPSGVPYGNLQSNGGFRVPLLDGLNSNPAFTGFNFQSIGRRGDGVRTTFGDGSVEYRGTSSGTVFPDANGDGLDGPNDTVSLHDGYSAWYIDAAAYGGMGALTPGNQGGIRDIVGNTFQNQINPGEADVIMLKIGVNDISPFVKEAEGLGGSSPYNSLSEMVDQLEMLIDDIAALAPAGSKVVVSTVLPVIQNRVSFDDTNYANDPMNTAIDAFNDELLADAFGGTWQDDSLGTDTWAQHDTYDNVILVDANSAISRQIAAGDLGTIGTQFSDLHTLYDDNLHLTPIGYANLADFYEDRFVALNIPEPTSAALLALVGGLVLSRRRRG